MGKISVVGIGPGSLDDMTYRARRTIEEATTVVGYKRYVDLIAELVEGKTVLDTGMTRGTQGCVGGRDGRRYIERRCRYLWHGGTGSRTAREDG